MFCIVNMFMVLYSFKHQILGLIQIELIRNVRFRILLRENQFSKYITMNSTQIVD